MLSSLDSILRAELIPIDLLKTFLVIYETASYSHAGQRLNLSQPAISVHVKRLQTIVGGDLFARAGRGVELTPKGEVILRYAQRILALSSEMLSVSGGRETRDAARVGIATAFSERAVRLLVKRHEDASLDRPYLVFAPSEELNNAIVKGYLDLAFCITAKPEDAKASTEEPLCWIGASSLTVSPGSPIPLLSRNDSLVDDLAMRILIAENRTFSRVCTVPDIHTLIAAAHNGLGVAPILCRLAPRDIVLSDRYFLPKLPGVFTGIFFRAGAAEDPLFARTAQLLSEIMQADSFDRC